MKPHHYLLPLLALYLLCCGSARQQEKSLAAQGAYLVCCDGTGSGSLPASPGPPMRVSQFQALGEGYVAELGSGTSPKSGAPATPGEQLPQAASPADPFRACAIQALAGKWGPLQPWQAHWYTLALEKGLTIAGHKRVTFYGPFDHDNGWQTYWLPWLGTQRCNRFTVSTPKWVPRGSILWTGLGLRFCGDRGGAVKHHFDLWSERDLGDTYHALPYRFLRWGWADDGHNPPLRGRP